MSEDPFHKQKVFLDELIESIKDMRYYVYNYENVDDIITEIIMKMKKLHKFDLNHSTLLGVKSK